MRSDALTREVFIDSHLVKQVTLSGSRFRTLSGTDNSIRDTLAQRRNCWCVLRVVQHQSAVVEGVTIVLNHREGVSCTAATGVRY